MYTIHHKWYHLIKIGRQRLNKVSTPAITPYNIYGYTYKLYNNNIPNSFNLRGERTRAIDKANLLTTGRNLYVETYGGRKFNFGRKSHYSEIKHETDGDGRSTSDRIISGANIYINIIIITLNTWYDGVVFILLLLLFFFYHVSSAYAKRNKIVNNNL